MSALHLPSPRWMTETGPDSDVVISSRCRIARNLAGEPFPWRAPEGRRKHAAELILEAAQRSTGALSRAIAISGDELDEEQTARLVELRYVSPDWTRGGSNRWALVSPDAATSLLVNEEDHLRLQTILPGLQVESVIDSAANTVSRLANHLRFAWEDRVGWLTASLTNAGMGLRLSVMLHLAGLAAMETLEAVLEAASEVGLSIRGLYGEGTAGTGEFFQVSNMCAFGVETRQIAESMAAAVHYLVAAERQARKERFSTPAGHVELEEAVAKALGLIFREELKPRRLLPVISVLRLAVAEGVVPGRLAHTAVWVSLVGLVAAQRGPADAARERFETVRRSAALRQSLRNFMEASGTFAPLPANGQPG